MVLSAQALPLCQPLTQCIFLTHKHIGFGRPRLMLSVVAMRGMSTSTAAILTAAIRASAIMFG